MWIIGQVVGGWLYATLFEWVAHKHVLHGLGKRKDSFWHFHWTHHHRCRKNGNRDPLYEGVSVPNTRYDKLKERLSVLGLVSTHTPLLWTPAYPFALTVGCMGLFYLWVHGYSHRNVEWGKKWLPHHYDHHMGKNQDANWGVTCSMWDCLLGTRER